MRPLNFFCLLPVLVLASSAMAAPVPCPPYTNAITIDFNTLRPDIRTNNALNVTGIREITRDANVPGLGAHTEALGVTVSTPVFSIDARTRIEPHGNATCVYLEGVKVEFGFRKMDVYVASEYPPGSCEYRAILDHENQHVSLSRAALADHAGRVRLALERLLGEQTPTYARDGGRATQTVLDGLSKRLEPEIDAFYADLDARNREIDTERNYEAIAAICKDWSRGNIWPQRPAER